MASKVAHKIVGRYHAGESSFITMMDDIDAAIDAAVLAEREACELIALRVRDAHRGPQGQSMSSMQRNIDMAKAASLIATNIRARNNGATDAK